MQWALLIALAVFAGLREAHWQRFSKDVQRTAEEMQQIIAREPDPDSKATVA
jgi:coproporphyrinogen III oxidase-like Fe-S oxidoreductase